MKKRVLSILLALCIVISLVPGIVSADSMQIYIQMISSGTTITVEAELTDTVAALKVKIQEKTGILPERQTLMWGGKTLEEEKTLEEYNIRTGATVHLVEFKGHIDHCVCGGSITTGGHAHEQTPDNWQPWDGTGEIVFVDGYARVYLTDNVSANLVLKEGEHLSLCLNGKAFTCKDKTRPAVVLEGTSKDSFSVIDICDCIGGGTLGGRTEGDKGGSIYGEWSNINLYGGTLTGNSGIKRGGAVAIDHTPLVMYGGKISGNSAENGGAVAQINEVSNKIGKDGNLIMYGGEISGNTATENGGAVYSYISYCYTTMNGGIISGNHAGQNGGGFYISRIGGIRMNDGEIKDNTATENGGGIYFDDSNYAYLFGGTISGNSAAKGGGVYLNNQQFTLWSITITGNTASKEGGGFWINTTSPYTLVANSPYIYGNSTTGIAPNIYLGSKNTAFKIYDSDEINADLGGNAKLGVYFTGIPDSGASVRSYGNSYNLSAATIDKFVCENPDFARLEARVNSVNPDRGYEGWLCNTAPETTVTFDPNGGTLVDGEQSKSVQRNGTYGTLPVPKRTGYRFDGWFTERDGGTKAEETTVVTTGEDHTLYAHWTFIHEHCICGGDVTVGNHTDHTKVVYKSWNGSDDIQYDSNNTAYVYLSQNAVISKNLAVPSGKTLYLCLGGKEYKSNGINKITVGEKNKAPAHLIICDCGGTGTIKGATKGWGGMGIYLYRSTLDFFGGKITGGKVTGSGGGGAIALDDSNCVLNIYGGEISGNNGKVIGGAVYFNCLDGKGGTVNMYGGEISGNKAQKGGVFFSERGGTVNLIGGTVSGNSATSNDGGVINMAGADITISGTKITGNTAKRYGGAIYLYDNSTLSMTGGEISGNTAVSEGGAVHAYGNNTTFNFSGGIIKNNSAKDGAAVYLNRQPSVLNMSGGTISDNTATGNGGAVYIFRSGSICNLSGGVIENNKAAAGGGIYIDPSYDGQLKISGNPIVKNNTVSGKANNVYLPSSKTLSTSAMTPGASIGITTGKAPAFGAPVVFGKACDNDYSGCFSSDNADYIPRYNSDKQLELSVITYTVTYNPGTNGSGETVFDLKQKDVALILKDALFTRAGYKQTGWTNIDGGEIIYGLEAVYTENEELTLYPVWTANEYTVKFDTAGGTLIGDRTGVTWSDKVLDGITSPTREGWNFEGFKCGDITVTASTAYADLAGDDSVSSVTLVAQWSDIEAPVGVIAIKSSTWREFLNSVTFGLFFKNTVGVTISADDNSGKPVKIEYLLSEETFETKDDIIGDWKVLNTSGNSARFNIEPDQKVFIYVRLTDQSGNDTVINSSGVVFYSDSEQGTEEITATVCSDEPKSFGVSLKGNTVKAIYIQNGQNTSNLIPADKYSVSEGGVITLKSEYMDSLKAGEYTLTVQYNPMGVAYVEGEGNDPPETTSVILKIVRRTAMIADLEPYSKDYDGNPLSAPTFTADSDAKAKIEYKPDGAEDSAYTENAPENAGRYTVRVSLFTTDLYSEAIQTTTAVIRQREVTIEGAAVKDSKIYDSNENAEIESNGTLPRRIEDDDLTIKAGTAKYSDKNVGTGKTVTFTGFKLQGEDKDNYILKSQPADTSADITARTLTVENIKVMDKSFDGTPTAALDGMPVLGGVVEGDDVSLLTVGTPSFTKTDIGDNIDIVFTEFTLTGADMGNYELIQPTGITASIKAYISDGSEYTADSDDWRREDFCVNANDGWLLSLTDEKEGEWSEMLTVSQENNNGTLTFYLKRKSDGVISEAVEKTYRIDKTEPTGEISIGEDYGWRGFSDELSFDLFCKDNQTVTVTATDNSGEAVTVEYLVTDEVLNREQLSEREFTLYGGEFVISPDTRAIVYVRLTDKAGNVFYLCSAGIVLDSTSPVISGAVNGETYCGAVTLTVSDDYLDTVTVNGEEVVLSAEGSLTITPASDKQTVIATDKAGNCASLTLTVNSGHTFGGWQSNGDGTHSRICRFDEEHNETASCTGGKATCVKRAKCDICGAEYGEVDGNSHENLVYFPAKASTPDKEGNTEYWYCEGCGRYYADKDGIKEISKGDTVTEKTGKTESNSDIPEDVPKTGDSGNLILWLAVLFVSGGVVIGGSVSRKKGRKG